VPLDDLAGDSLGRGDGGAAGAEACGCVAGYVGHLSEGEVKPEHAGEMGAADSAGRAVRREGREEAGAQAAHVERVTVGVAEGVAVDTEAGEEWEPDLLEKGEWRKAKADGQVLSGSRASAIEAQASDPRWSKLFFVLMNRSVAPAASASGR